MDKLFSSPVIFSESEVDSSVKNIFVSKIDITNDYFDLLQHLFYLQKKKHQMNNFHESLQSYFFKTLLNEDFALFLRDVNLFVDKPHNIVFRNSIFIEAFLCYK